MWNYLTLTSKTDIHQIFFFLVIIKNKIHCRFWRYLVIQNFIYHFFFALKISINQFFYRKKIIISEKDVHGAGGIATQTVFVFIRFGPTTNISGWKIFIVSRKGLRFWLKALSSLTSILGDRFSIHRLHCVLNHLLYLFYSIYFHIYYIKTWESKT